MKTPIITEKDVLRGKKIITFPAIFTEEAFEQLTIYYDAGLKNEMHNLDKSVFIGLMTAVGIVGCTQGTKQDNEKDRMIQELEDELNKLKKAQK